MQRIAIERRVFDAPTDLTIEASLDIITANDLNLIDGEQYDQIPSVISIDIDGSDVVFEMVRSHAAWKRGVPDAGRGRWVIPRAALEAIWV